MQEILLGGGGGSRDEYNDVFLGEVLPENFITGLELGNLTGVASANRNNNEPWLHFRTRDEKELFIAKKIIKWGITWNDLAALNLIYGDKEVTIKGSIYKVRLMTGSNSDPVDYSTTTFQSNNSEWDRLLYMVYTGHTGSSPLPPGRVPLYTGSQLGIQSGVGGRETWCQESAIPIPENPTEWTVLRGGDRINLHRRTSKAVTLTQFGWRPVLELVE